MAHPLDLRSLGSELPYIQEGRIVRSFEIVNFSFEYAYARLNIRSN